MTPSPRVASQSYRILLNSVGSAIGATTSSPASQLMHMVNPMSLRAKRVSFAPESFSSCATLASRFSGFEIHATWSTWLMNFFIKVSAHSAAATAIDSQCLSSDVTGLLACKEGTRRCDLLRPANTRNGIPGDDLFVRNREQVVIDCALRHGSQYETRGHVIDSDALRAQF